MEASPTLSIREKTVINLDANEAWATVQLGDREPFRVEIFDTRYEFQFLERRAAERYDPETHTDEFCVAVAELVADWLAKRAGVEHVNLFAADEFYYQITEAVEQAKKKSSEKPTPNAPSSSRGPESAADPQTVAESG